MRFTNKSSRKSSYLAAAIYSATGTGLTLFPRHAIKFSSVPGSRDVLTESHEPTIPLLNNAINLVSISMEFVEVDVVKGALSRVCTVLILVRDMKSETRALVELALSCADTCLVLKRGMAGKTGEDISPAISTAISDLTRTVKAIQGNIAKSARRRSLVKAFHSNPDKDKISGWMQELNRLIILFSTELKVVIDLKVEDTNNEPADVDQDVKAPVDIHTASVPDGVSSRGQEIPPPPELLFGRDGFVESTAESLQNKHVALTGPGGIGKSSIAKAVLHHPSIAARFGINIFFVRCDNLVVSLDTLLNRIGKVVGATISQSDPLHSLRTHFLSCSKPLLLVLDNAETILDPDTDQAPISEFLDELASFSDVNLLLTTGTTTPPNNASWCHMQVPPLDERAARDAFHAVYDNRDSLDAKAVDGLLESLDRHPLSINLLASACTQNEWTTPELSLRWNDQNTSMSDFGDDTGRLRSLSVSIELSLDSPVILKLGRNARHVLRVIALLPQGVDHNRLSSLFPSVPNIESVIDTMQQMSLMHRNDDFLTVLAPIRLHVLHAGPSEFPLLKDAQIFYFGELRQCRNLHPGDEGFNKGAWIVSEDDNVEGLIARSDNSPDTYYACYDFLDILRWHKPRRTILGAKIRSFPEGDDELAWLKTRCLQRVGRIAESMGRFMDALEMYAAARSLALSRNDQALATRSLHDLAHASHLSGKLSDAESQYTEVLALYCELKDLDGEARCNERLGLLMRQQGNLSQASQFLGKALEYFEKMQMKRKIGHTKGYLGSIASDGANYAEARQYLDGAVAIFTDLGDHQSLGGCLTHYAGMEQKLKNWTMVHDRLERAERSFMAVNSTRQAAHCLRKRGQAYILQKEFSSAEEFVRRADGIFVGLGSCSWDHALCVYYLAWIEKDQRRFEKAIALYTQSRDLFAEIGDVSCQARCSAGLGEISFAKKDYDIAEKSFREAKRKSEDAGLSLTKIEGEVGSSRGWRWFRETHLTVGEQPGTEDGPEV